MSLVKVSFKTLENLAVNKKEWVLYIAKPSNAPITQHDFWYYSEINSTVRTYYKKYGYTFLLLPYGFSTPCLGTNVFGNGEYWVYING